MDSHVAKLSTPEECDQFVINVQATHPDLAREARRRGIELRAQQYGAKTDVEREAIEAIFAYEAVLSAKKGKKVRAGRTWPLIEKYGIIGAIEVAVDREHDPTGYRELASMGMQDKSFEAVVLRHRAAFSPEVVAHSEKRLAQHTSDGGDA